MLGNSSEAPHSRPVTYGLVHGAWHGAWCWEELKPELEQAGHNVVTMDLPIENPDATDLDYAREVASAVGKHDNLILVGHSMGGRIIPLVAELVTVKSLVYLCAALRDPYDEQYQTSNYETLPKRNSTEFLRGIIQLADGSSVYDKNLATEIFYQDCEDAVAQNAISRLRRQYRRYAEIASRPSSFKGSSHYILCEEDRAINPAWSLAAARQWLGVEPVVMPGGHSPFLSRPKELANILLPLAI